MLNLFFGYVAALVVVALFAGLAAAAEPKTLEQIAAEAREYREIGKAEVVPGKRVIRVTPDPRGLLVAFFTEQIRSGFIDRAALLGAGEEAGHLTVLAGVPGAPVVEAAADAAAREAEANLRPELRDTLRRWIVRRWAADFCTVATMAPWGSDTPSPAPFEIRADMSWLDQAEVWKTCEP